MALPSDSAWRCAIPSASPPSLARTATPISRASATLGRLGQNYWRNPTPENREACRDSLAPETIRQWQYFNGSDRSRVSPDGYTLDLAYLARPGADEIQLDLILDYRTNPERYPDFQAYFRSRRPPLLAVWGRNDAHFLPAGAEAYRRDLPDAEITLLDAGHFALETHAVEIGALMRDFFERHGV